VIYPTYFSLFRPLSVSIYIYIYIYLQQTWVYVM
jgi:hypothetical protein